MDAETVESLCERLVSTTKKDRDAGFKALKNLISSNDFQDFLDEQTKKIDSSDTFSSSWPGLIKAFIGCTEQIAKGKRGPNVEYARVLLTLITKAEKRSSLFRIARILLKHIYEMLQVPQYEAIYSKILTSFIAKDEYLHRMTKKLYADFINFLASRNLSALGNQDSFVALLSLIKRPPGDLEEKLQAPVVAAVRKIFTPIISGKLLELPLDSVIGLLKHDGPNLGPYLYEIHASVGACLYRVWTTPIEDALKERGILYFRMQLNLGTITADVTSFGRLLEFVQKELDGMSWDAKLVLSGCHLSFLHLSARAIYEFLRQERRMSRVNENNDTAEKDSTGSNKRIKVECLGTALRDRVASGKASWMGTACLLLRDHGTKLQTELLYSLLNSSVSCLDRISNEAISVGNIGAPLWGLRCLSEACIALVPGVEQIMLDKALWRSVWDAVSRRLVLFHAVPVLIEEALRCLALLLHKIYVAVPSVPTEFWDLAMFKGRADSSTLLFLAAFSSSPGAQLELDRRRWLLRWCSSSEGLANRIPPKTLSGALLGLSAGVVQWPLSEMAKELRSWSELQIQEEAELVLLDQSEESLVATALCSHATPRAQHNRKCKVRQAESHALLEVLGESLLESVEAMQAESKQPPLDIWFQVCTTLLYCLKGVSMVPEISSDEMWSADGRVSERLVSMLQLCAPRFERIRSIIDCTEHLTDESLKALSELASALVAAKYTGLEAVLKALSDLTNDAHLPSFTPDPSQDDDQDVRDVLETRARNIRGSSWNWKSMVISFVLQAGAVNTEAAYDVLRDMLTLDNDMKHEGEILLGMCRLVQAPSLQAELVESVGKLMEKGQNIDAVCRQSLSAVHLLLSKGAPVQQELLSLVQNAMKKKFLTWRTRSVLGDVIAKSFLVSGNVDDYAGGLLVLLSDPDFRVRMGQCRHIPLMFNWSNHEQIFADVCNNLNVDMPMATSFRVVTCSEASQSSRKGVWTKTALLCLGEVALASQDAETEAVYMILAQAAIEPTHRLLAVTIIGKLAKSLGYPDRWKYLKQLSRGVISRCVISEIPISALFEIADIFVAPSGLNAWCQSCLTVLLPHLILHERVEELDWLARSKSTQLKTLVTEHYAPVVATLLALHCGETGLDKERFVSVLQGPLLSLCELTETERDSLVTSNMASIISHFLLLVNAPVAEPMSHQRSKCLMKGAALAGVKTMLDELCDGPGISDQVFQPDRIFEIVLLVHTQASDSYHFRHRRHSLAILEALVEIIDEKAAIPGVFRYLLHVALLSLDIPELQDACCALALEIVKKLEKSSTSTSSWILGDQLQSVVSKLVSCIVSSPPGAAAVMSLLLRFTVEADASQDPYLKDLDPFPNIACFEPLRKWQLMHSSDKSFSADFVKFVRRAPYLSSQQRFRSLQSFCDALRDRKASNSKEAHLSDEVVVSIWELVHLCDEADDFDIRTLIAELLTAAGIANPDAVLFELPETARARVADSNIVSTDSKTGISENIVKAILVQLCNCLLDQNATVVQLGCRTVKGLLATEKGLSTVGKLTAQEQAYFQVHSQGIDLNFVNTLLEENKLQSSQRVKSLKDQTLWSTDGKSYSTWISSLVYSLIEYTDDPFLRLCQDLILVKPMVAELLLPHVFGYLAGKLETVSESYRDMVSQIQAHIFCNANENKRSIQLFLEAFNSLRLCYVESQRSGRSCTWPKVYWLDVDYLVTAKAAQRCAAYFSSLLYVEHWCESHFGRSTLGEPQYDSNQLPEHLELMLTICTSINEPDGAYGTVHMHMHSPSSQVRIYEHEGNWPKAIQSNELLLGSGANIRSYKGILQAFKQEGCYRVHDTFCAGLAKSNAEVLMDKEIRELQCESAWKLAQWDCSVTAEATDLEEYGFNEGLHRSFKCLIEGDSDKFQLHIKHMQSDLVSHVMHTSLESTQNVHPAIIKLQIVDCLSQACDFRWIPGSVSSVTPSDAQVLMITKYWKEMQRQTNHSYKLLEPVGMFVRVLFKVLQRLDQIPNLLKQQAMLARKAGMLNHAALAVQELKNFFQTNPALRTASKISRTIRVEGAKTIWAQGHQTMAVNLVKHLLSQTDKPGELSDLYCLTGKWLSKTNSASSQTIVDLYFKKSVEQANEAWNLSTESRACIRRKCKAHFHLAHFANCLYQSCEDRLRSSEWQSGVRLKNHREKELRDMLEKSKNPKTSKEEKNDCLAKANDMYKELQIDNNEETRLKEDLVTFRNMCLEHYRECLLTGNKYDDRVVFRLVSLWFTLSSDKAVVSDMLNTAMKVNSFKFLPLVYQIASRIKTSVVVNDFSYVVCYLVRKMATEHPYHTLYQLFAFANGDRIKDNQRSKNAFVFDQDKKQAAEEILLHLDNEQPERLREVKLMVDLYIKLAQYQRPKTTGPQPDTIAIPRDIRSAVKELVWVPVLTADVKVNRECLYPVNSYPHFMGFANELRIMNGVNVPKVVKCRGSDGEIYRQLVKSGDDDLRQDAVMEQLFGLVNNLLKSDPETRKRNLQLRTYKVIPFTPSAGAIEWVEGTLPLGDYLIKAHLRYRPNDWTFSVCRNHMHQSKDKLATFKEVCNNFRPVMRQFFIENSKRPADWFTKRLAYTRSLATSSMVGYIVGLGDRHAMNILLDEATAEVVHIDLGIAFEQGKILRTPETVPFRLTRDIVDGMGVTGVEGVFRRCSEHTLSVLRSNKEALMTIIEVFLHDPLYKWALSPLKAMQKQQDNMSMYLITQLEADKEAEEGNKDAARALFRVKQKLDGYEGGELRTVEGQVKQLIQDAQDPERLCKIFPGWGAWL